MNGFPSVLIFEYKAIRDENRFKTPALNYVFEYKTIQDKNHF